MVKVSYGDSLRLTENIVNQVVLANKELELFEVVLANIMTQWIEANIELVLANIMTWLIEANIELVLASIMTSAVFRYP